MKKIIIFSVLAFILSSVDGLSQHILCGTDQSDIFMQDLRANKKYFEVTKNKKRVDRFIPITIQSVARNDGSGRIKDLQIYEAICRLNQRFFDTDMRFYVHKINYVDNTGIYNDSTNPNVRVEMGNIKDLNSLNIYTVGDPGRSFAGYYTRGLDLIVIKQTVLTDISYTLEHEVGHFFTLPHTHRGWDQIGNGREIVDGGYDPAIHNDTVTITSVTSPQSGTVLVELVDGSNCDIAADEICDTPPDYGFGFTCDCCTMVFDVWDANGDRIFPMIDNVMSYSDDCKPYRLSDGQKIAMWTDHDSERRDYIRGEDSIAVFNPIESTTTLISPGLLETVESYNGVLFTWEKNPNADFYFVQIEGDIQLEFTATETQLYVDKLSPNEQYFWSVTPVNKFGASCDVRDVLFFNTGAGTTSIQEDEHISAFNLLSNPTKSGQPINIYIQSREKNEGQMTLFDLNGKVTHTKEVQLSEGENYLAMETYRLSTGLYILEIKTKKGKITEKVIIE